MLNFLDPTLVPLETAPSLNPTLFYCLDAVVAAFNLPVALMLWLVEILRFVPIPVAVFGLGGLRVRSIKVYSCWGEERTCSSPPECKVGVFGGIAV